MSKTPNMDFHLSVSDCDAIICSLPLVCAYKAYTPKQSAVNALLCDSAAQKLLNGKKTFSINELRVMSASISLAKFLLSGKSDPNLPEIDSDWKADLNRYIFDYNRLDQVFSDLVDPLLP